MCDNAIVAPADGGRQSPAAASSGPAWAANGRGSPAAASSGAKANTVVNNATHARMPRRAPNDGTGDGAGARRADRAFRPAAGSEGWDATFP